MNKSLKEEDDDFSFQFWMKYRRKLCLNQKRDGEFESIHFRN